MRNGCEGCCLFPPLPAWTDCLLMLTSSTAVHPRGVFAGSAETGHPDSGPGQGSSRLLACVASKKCALSKQVGSNFQLCLIADPIV